MKTSVNHEMLSYQEMADTMGGMMSGPFMTTAIGIKIGEWILHSFDDFKAGLMGKSLK